MLMQKYSRTLFALQISNEVRGKIVATVVDGITGSRDRFGTCHIFDIFIIVKFLPFTFIYTPFYIFIYALYIP